MKINQNTFETEFGKLTIGFPPDWDLEEYIQEAVYGEEKMKIRRWAGKVAYRKDGDAEKFEEMTAEEKQQQYEDDMAGKDLDPRAAAFIERKCEWDERALRQNFRVGCPTERLLRDLIWWAQEAEEEGGGPKQLYKLVRQDMLRLVHFLRKIRADCFDPRFWNTTAELPFPEGGVPMSAHPKAPEAFFRLWHIAHYAENENRTLMPEDSEYEENWDDDIGNEKGVDPVYIINELPGSLVPWHDNWGDVSFKMDRIDGEITEGKAPADYVPDCPHGRRIDSNCNDCKKEG